MFYAVDLLLDIHSCVDQITGGPVYDNYGGTLKVKKENRKEMRYLGRNREKGEIPTGASAKQEGEKLGQGSKLEKREILPVERGKAGRREAWPGW